MMDVTENVIFVEDHIGEIDVDVLYCLPYEMDSKQPLAKLPQISPNVSEYHY